jgi:6,7-dimethyl-8-ribityllumazine synthase
LQPTVHEGRLNAEGFRFAIVASRWNEFISGRLVEGALDGLERLGAKEGESKSTECRAHSRSRCSPFVSLSRASLMQLFVLVRSFEVRLPTSITSLTRSRVAFRTPDLESGLPVVFGVVTADTVDQAIDRAGVKLGNKGFEAAMTAVELANLYRESFEA